MKLIFLLLFFFLPYQDDATVLVYRPTERIKRDLDDILETRVVRVLVAHSMTNFFIDAGQPRGFEYEMMQEYEKYLKRAERHVESVPQQAVADLTRALELAPEKRKAGILRQRAKIYVELGQKEEALGDLSAYAASPQAHKGAQLLSDIVGVELEQTAAIPTEMEIGALQKELALEGVLQGVGTCRRCKDAVELDEPILCRGALGFWTVPTDIEALIRKQVNL